MFSEHEIPRFNFEVDLKAQSKHHQKNCPVRMYTKLFDVKKWLNMESKTDKESRRDDDITFLSEIITNSRNRKILQIKVLCDQHST